MKKSIVYSLMLILAVILVVPTLSACSSTTAPVAATTATVETEIYNNINIAGVINNPTGGPTTFTITGSYNVTLISDYHWNNSQGAAAGTIGLKDSSGKVIGTWPATVRSGVYWDVKPNINIGPDTYTVIDSDPSTWAQNSQSNNQGFTDIKGLAITYAESTQSPSGSSSSTPSQVRTGDIKVGPKVDLASQTIGNDGGGILVSKPGDPLDGFSLGVPPQAYSANTTFKVSYAPVTKQTFGDDFTPASPLITIDNGGTLSDELMYVQVPVKIPDGYMAMGFLYDDKTKQLEGMPLISQDAGSVTVATLHFSSFIIGMIDKMKLKENVDSGFTPGIDDWQFTNYGSYIAPGGQCEGQSLSEMWYYCTQPDGKDLALYGRYDNNGNQPATPDLWQDDSLGYRFVSTVHADNSTFIGNQGSSAYGTWAGLAGRAWKKVNNKWQWADVPQLISDGTTRDLFAFAIQMTGEPQLIKIQNDSGGGGHTMVVYKTVGNALYIADPNYPGNTDRKVIYYSADGVFKPYNSGATKADIDAGRGTSYNHIMYFGKSTLVDWGTIANRWAEFKKGTIGNDKFPAYKIIYVDGSGKHKDLTDGTVFTVNKVNIGLDLIGTLGGFAVYRDGAWLQSDAKGNYELQPGNNLLGIWVVKQVGTKYQYVDFKYINVIYNSATTTDSGMLAILQTKTIFTGMLDLYGVLTDNGTENPGTYPGDHQFIQVDAIGLKWNGASFTANTKAGTTGTVSGTMSPDGNTLLNLTVNITQPDGSFIEKCSYTISNLPVKWVKNGGVYSSGIDGAGLNTYISGFSWQEADSKDTLSFAPDWTDKTNSLNIYFNP